MINRLTPLAASKKPLLTCYLPIGDPALPADLAAIYADCGVDVFEVGIPTDDPWMDGPVVAGSMRRTLAAGIDQAFIGKALAKLRSQFARQAMVVMGYDNIRLKELIDGPRPAFDGLLCVGADAGELIAAAASIEADAVAPIPFIAFEMPKADIDRARATRGGYVMLQAAPGKTGSGAELDKHLEKRIASLRQAGICIPILPGFGISSAGQAAAVIQAGADGVIIGSACLQQAQQGAPALRAFLTGLRKAIDGC